MKKVFDIIILGGGIAGCCTALALSQLPGKLKIAIVEKAAPDATRTDSAPQAGFDDRCLALGKGSVDFLRQLGVWQHLQQDAESSAAAIQTITIGEQGMPGTARITQPRSMGYVVELKALGNTLVTLVQQQTDIEYLCPAQAKKVDFATPEAHPKAKLSVDIDKDARQSRIFAKLLIAADGARAFAHQFLSRPPQISDYLQTAIICNIQTQYPHDNRAYERFTPSGPIAVLPLSQQRCSVVWTVKNTQVKTIMALDDQAFQERFQQQFGYRLGAITRVGQRSAFPLRLMRLPDQAVREQTHLLFVGNAAHAIHPVAGQGFNLGLRDIQALQKVLHSHLSQDKHYLDTPHHLINEYWDRREADILRTIRFTDTLIKTFSNRFFPVTPARNLGLVLFDVSPMLKNTLARYAMGVIPA